MPCLFISHSSLDREVVEREIISPLRAHGVDTWYSTDDIQTASEWERQIHKGLMTCDWFLVALSPRAVDSEWVRREVHWAVMKRKNNIIPVMLETCEPEDLHLGLLPIQYIDFRDGGERAFERLLAVWGLDKATQVKSLYGAAQGLIAKEEWAAATEKLRAVLSLDPEHSDARMQLDRLKVTRHFASLYEDGVKAVREKRWRQALEKLRQIRKAEGRYPDVEELIALASAELEKEEAGRLFGEALEAAGQEEWAKAVDLLQAVLKITPSNNEAQSAFNRALQQKDLAELYAAGRAHMEAGRWSEALKMFRRVRVINRDYKGVGELIADVDALLAEKEEQRTKGAAQEREARGEAARPLQQTQGQVAEEVRRGIDGEKVEGREKAESAQSAEDVRWRTKHKLVSVFILSVISVVAILLALSFLTSPNTSQKDNSNISVTSGSTRAADHNEKAEALSEQKKYPEAEAEYRQAVEIEPDNAKYRDDLGLALLQQKKYGEAEAEYRKAVELDPNSADYHNRLGLTLIQQTRYLEAEAEYRKAIQLDSNNASYHVDLAGSLHYQQKHVAEKEELLKALQIDPSNRMAKLNLDHSEPPRNHINKSAAPMRAYPQPPNRN
jgi:tetratricopeptide (TPR) repeat protein